MTALGVLPVLPAEHVHEGSDAEGHHVLVVHRHVQLHTVDARASGQRPTVDHSDPFAIDLDGVYTASGRYLLQAPLAVAAVIVRPTLRAAPARRRFSDQLIHAPPRAPSSLRAPPALRLL